MKVRHTVDSYSLHKKTKRMFSCPSFYILEGGGNFRISRQCALSQSPLQCMCPAPQQWHPSDTCLVLSWLWTTGGYIINTMRFEYLVTSPAYHYLEPHMDLLERQGYWKRVERTVFDGFFQTVKQGITHVYQKIWVGADAAPPQHHELLGWNLWKATSLQQMVWLNWALELPKVNSVKGLGCQILRNTD